jgi:hypothetical protein
MLVESAALTTWCIKIDKQSNAAPLAPAWRDLRRISVRRSDSEVLSSFCVQAKQHELKQSKRNDVQVDRMQEIGMSRQVH